ncbi:unnamed protein product [Cylicocyclus nassatus]|uniref:Uncharacterized protein n=1 Tax=Cylicocyclus nassatus TaxID=53992 RepID=A0AA36GNG6_CYLNA|nr:unnamed protein product [Cylicocyclus nassatus]
MWSLLFVVGRFFLVLLVGTIMILPYTLYCKRKPHIKARKVGPSIRETKSNKESAIIAMQTPEPLPSVLPEVKMEGKSPDEAHKENVQSVQKALKGDNLKGSEQKEVKDEGKEFMIYGLNDGKKESDYEDHIAKIEPTQVSSRLMQETQASSKHLQATQDSV